MKTLIVDDENKGRQTLKQLLLLLNAPVTIVAEATNVQEAVKEIQEKQPELVFLDIQLTDGTGFDVLEQITFKNFHLIFITAHEEFALKAFRYSAIDYITKPIDPDILDSAIKKVQNLHQQFSLEKKLEVLLQNKQKVNKLALPSTNGIQLAKIQDIIRCEASNNYTLFYLTDGKKIMVTKTLKDYEEMLMNDGFFRVHQSHLINLDFVSGYLKQDGGYVQMTDGSQIEISRRKKDAFLSLITQK